MNDNVAFENSKIVRSIWKNTFDKILEIKISNKRALTEMREKIMNEEKKKIDLKYKKQYDSQYTENKIEVSTAKNQSNLEKMKKKNDLVNKIIEDTLEKIKEFANPNSKEYQSLLKQLIIESMVKLLESTCYIQVRKEDEKYVKSILNECEKNYSDFMKKETSRDYHCKLIIDNEYYDNEFGGVKLMNSDKKIILANSLQDRLMLCQEQHLPEIKKMLFPKVK